MDLMKAAIHISFLVNTLSHWQAANGQLSQSQMEHVLTTHNQFRSEVLPTASNLLEMVWNEELANVAQSYSQQCVFAHNKMRNDQSATFQFVGENIAFLGPLSTWGENELLRLLNLWNDEKVDYSLSANTCSRVCGHYTQLVWADTDKVGCGVTLCSNLTIPGRPSVRNSLNLVCNYAPAGNFNSRVPYAKGISCSACPSGYSCSDKLCSMKESSSVQPLTTKSPTTVTSSPKPVHSETTHPISSNPNTPSPKTTVPVTSKPNTPGPKTTVSTTFKTNTPDSRTTVIATSNPNTLGAETTVPVTSKPNTPGPKTTVPATFKPNTPDSRTIVIATSNPNTSGAETTVPVTSAPVQPNISRIIAIYFRIIERLRLFRFIKPRVKNKIISRIFTENSISHELRIRLLMQTLDSSYF